MRAGMRLGVDLGGTKCSVVAADEQYHIFHKTVFATGGETEPERIIRQIITLCKEYIDLEKEQRELLSVGVSCGGPLDEQTGRIYSPPNLPLWDDIALTDILSRSLGVSAFLKNDANACALAEWKMGAGRGTRNMVFLTFGTGMGAGLILDGKLYNGTCGMAGEVGHIRLSEEGPQGYGKRGSFEGYCSGGGIARLAKEMTGELLSAKEVCRRADIGDQKAKEILDTSAYYLGRGIAVLVDVLNPECIVIGSIYQRAQSYFKNKMNQILREEALGVSYKICRIVPAMLGDNLGDVACLMAGERD